MLLMRLVIQIRDDDVNDGQSAAAAAAEMLALYSFVISPPSLNVLGAPLKSGAASARLRRSRSAPARSAASVSVSASASASVSLSRLATRRVRYKQSRCSLRTVTFGRLIMRAPLSSSSSAAACASSRSIAKLVVGESQLNLFAEINPAETVGREEY